MAFVVFEDGSGVRHTLEHGDQIGRSKTAALALEDRRISVAHAQVALRPDGLVLLALRGELLLDGQPVDDAMLDEGQVFTLPDGTELRVVDVEQATGTKAYEATERSGVAPLCLTAKFESVEIRGAGLPKPLVLTGIGALILIELIREGEPVHWYRIARRIWPLSRGQSANEHKESIRARWYQATARLRREIEMAGLERPVFEARSGVMVLLTLPSDVVINEAD